MMLMGISSDTPITPRRERPYRGQQGVWFASEGEASNGNVLLLQTGEEAEGSTSEKKENRVKSDDIEMVNEDDDKCDDAEQDDAEFKPKLDDDESEEEKDVGDSDLHISLSLSR